MIILGVETSCDETSVALVEDGRNIIHNLVSSQIKLHQPFGGVVPELASRAHLENILPLLKQLGPRKILADIDAVAFTRGPGLIGALLVGAAVAKGIAFALDRPLVGINHLKAHLYAPCLEGAEFEFPLIGFVVSGGHTLLVKAESWEESRILGSTRDDAAGEAFDKVASLLGLGYPGGPNIQRVSAKGDPTRFCFPRAMLATGTPEFSFSGLKTAVRQTVEELRNKGEPIPVADIAASFQEAVIEVLVKKLLLVSPDARMVTVGGGVICNSVLRQRIQKSFESTPTSLAISSPRLCGDNAAMIAGLAYQRLSRSAPDDLGVDCAPGLGWGTTLY